MKRFANLFALAAVCLAPAVNAQSISVKWGTTSKAVYLHTAMPAGCDTALKRAVDVWNAAGSKFLYQFDPANNLTTTRWTQSNNSNVTIEDGATAGTALMSTARRTSGSTIIDADILVKADYLWYYSDESGGLFHCPPSGSAPPSSYYDYQSAVGHELGHAMGFDHGGTTSCIMYAFLGSGISRRSLCTAETTAIRSSYGVR